MARFSNLPLGAKRYRLESQNCLLKYKKFSGVTMSSDSFLKIKFSEHPPSSGPYRLAIDTNEFAASNFHPHLGPEFDLAGHIYQRRGEALYLQLRWPRGHASFWLDPAEQSSLANGEGLELELGTGGEFFAQSVLQTNASEARLSPGKRRLYVPVYQRNGGVQVEVIAEELVVEVNYEPPTGGKTGSTSERFTIENDGLINVQQEPAGGENHFSLVFERNINREYSRRVESWYETARNREGLTPKWVALEEIRFRVSNVQNSASGDDEWGRRLPRGLLALKVSDIRKRVKHRLLAFGRESGASDLPIPEAIWHLMVDGDPPSIFMPVPSGANKEGVRSQIAKHWTVTRENLFILSEGGAFSKKVQAGFFVAETPAESGGKSGTLDVIKAHLQDGNDHIANLHLSSPPPVTLVVDLGASSQLAAMVTDKGDVTIIDSGPHLGDGHDDAEAPAMGFITRSPLELFELLTEAPFFESTSLARALKIETSSIHIIPGSSANPYDPSRLRATPTPDLKGLIHARPGDRDKPFGINGQPTTPLEIYKNQIFARVQDVMTKPEAREILRQAQTNWCGNDAPIMALALTYPGYVRWDVHLTLLEVAHELSEILHKGFLRPNFGFTDDPLRYVGAVRFLPEPVALAAQVMTEPKFKGTEHLLCVDVGNRTFDIAALSRTNAGWKFHGCSGANLGGKMLDYVLLKAIDGLIPALPAPFSRSPVYGEILKINDNRLWEHLRRGDIDGLKRDMKMLQQVEIAKSTWSANLETDPDADLVLHLPTAISASFLDWLASALARDDRIRFSWQDGGAKIRIKGRAILDSSAMDSYLAACRASLSASIARFPEDTGEITIVADGRCARFPPLRKTLTDVLPSAQLEELDKPQRGKLRIVHGAAKLANDHGLLVQNVEKDVFWTILDGDGRLLDFAQYAPDSDAPDVQKLSVKYDGFATLLEAPGEVLTLLQNINPTSRDWAWDAFFLAEAKKKCVTVKSEDEITIRQRSSEFLFRLWELETGTETRHYNFLVSCGFKQ